MSIKSWIAEYYPVPADEATVDDLTAARHSLRKWQGATREALAKHRLKKPPIEFSSLSCALCRIHISTGCADCPIASDTMRCDTNGPFGGYVYQQNPQQMIDVLIGAVKRLDKDTTTNYTI